MIEQFRPAISIFIAFTILTGAVYPAVITGIAQTFFPYQANGSILRYHDQPLGSKWIGQHFTDPKYFWGRGSATSSTAYNAAASSGSNLGPMNPALPVSIKERVDALKQYETPEGQVPIDLVTSSASGLDPHISPAAAEYQIPRIAKLRNVNESWLQELISAHTQGRQFGLFGEPRVNVLELNLAMDNSAGLERLPTD